jgi:transposase-like protein
MGARGAELSAGKQRAIDALLVHPSVEEAARVAGVEYKVLMRWMKEPDFKDALGAGQLAEYRQSMRLLRQGMLAAAATIVKIMQSGATPARRLKAARIVLRLAPDVLAMQAFAAQVGKAESAAGAEAPARERARSPIRGHGARFPRKKDKAVAALLTQRSVAEAARAVGVARSTLCQWMEEPAFDARLRAAAGSAFGPATRILLLSVNYARSLLHSLLDPAIPDATRLEAAVCYFNAGKALEKEDLGAHMAPLEPAEDCADGEPAVTSQTLGRIFYQRLHRLKAALLPANLPDEEGFEFVQAEDGKAAGPVSVPGPAEAPPFVVAPEAQGA